MLPLQKVVQSAFHQKSNDGIDPYLQSQWGLEYEIPSGTFVQKPPPLSDCYHARAGVSLLSLSQWEWEGENALLASHGGAKLLFSGCYDEDGRSRIQHQTGCRAPAS